MVESVKKQKNYVPENYRLDHLEIPKKKYKVGKSSSPIHLHDWWFIKFVNFPENHPAP